MTKKNNIWFITAAVAALVIAITAISSAGFNAEVEIQKMSSERQEIFMAKAPGRVAGAATEQAQISVQRPSGNSISLQLDLDKRISAYDALKELAKAYNLEISANTFAGFSGILVTQIGELKNGQDEMYWMLYINGSLGEKAADETYLNSGDKVEFRFEKSAF